MSLKFHKKKKENNPLTSDENCVMCFTGSAFKINK